MSIASRVYQFREGKNAGREEAAPESTVDLAPHEI
jgi:hypothetical protein